MNVLKRILKGVILKPESTTPSDASNGALWYDSTLGKLRGYISGSARSVVNEDQSQTLTNKTIDADSNTLSNIKNGDIKATAAIDVTKLAAVTVSKALASNGSGFISAATTTATELDYLSGVTSGVQSQLNAKASTSDLNTHMSDTTTHGTTGDIVGTSDTQNLSNKTFTNVTNFTDTTESTTKDTGALVIEGGVGIEKSVTVGVNLEVLGNLTVQGTTTTLNTATLDVEDANITINNGGNDAGAEGSGLTIDRTGTSGSFVYEDALASKFKLGAAGSEAQVVTVSHTQTLTNKTLTSPSLTTPSLDVMTLDGQASTPASPSAGFYKAYVKDSTNKLTLLDSSGNETSIGAGGGSVNFVTNPDAEAGTTGWTIDSFAAAARPAGAFTGTTSGITFSTSSSSPLSGVNSFTLAKDASNRQGRVVYTPITIQPAYQAKVLNISIDYVVSSGTFVVGSSGVDSDVIVYLQDVTNSTFIEPSSFKLLSSSVNIADKFQGTFQTSATGTSYRLLLYFPTTTTSAFTLKLDNISVSPSNYVFGTPITDWQSYTPTIVGAGSHSLDFAQWRRAGDSVEVRSRFTTGTPTGVTATFTLPNSIVVNQPGSPTTAGAVIGQTSSPLYAVDLIATNGSNILTFGVVSGGLSSQLGNTVFGTTSVISFHSNPIPILGWSSSVQMSDSADTRVVAAKMTSSDTPSFPVSTLTKVTWNTNESDSHGMVDLANDRFIIIVPGDYSFDMAYFFNTVTSTGNGSIQAYVRINNTTNYFIAAAGRASGVTQYQNIGSSTIVRNLRSGDYVELHITQDIVSGGMTGLNGLNHFSATRISGPSAIAASESVNARYYASSSSITGSFGTITYSSKDYDSHGAYSGGIFTAPISGKYSFNAGLVFTHASVASTNACGLAFLVNNSVLFADDYFSWTTTAPVQVGLQISDTIKLNAGDTVRVQSLSSGTTPTVSASNSRNFFSWSRVGN